MILVVCRFEEIHGLTYEIQSGTWQKKPKLITVLLMIVELA